MKRSEEEKIVQSGIEVILGGQTYQVRPLVIIEAREWRQKVIKLIAPVPEAINTPITKAKKYEDALKEMLVDIPEEVADLFFDYAKDLNREEIEKTATDAELAVAFEEVVKVAFPLTQSLLTVMTRLTR